MADHEAIDQVAAPAAGAPADSEVELHGPKPHRVSGRSRRPRPAIGSSNDADLSGKV